MPPTVTGIFWGISRDDAPIQEDPTAGHVTDVDQGRPLVSSLAATHPHITNVPAATTPTVFVGDNERILARVLVQPSAGLGIEYHGERSARQELIATSRGGSDLE